MKPWCLVVNHESTINWIIDNLWQGNIQLNEDQLQTLDNISQGQLPVENGCLVVTKQNVDAVYHVLASYLSKMEVS